LPMRVLLSVSSDSHSGNSGPRVFQLGQTRRSHIVSRTHQRERTQVLFRSQARAAAKRSGTVKRTPRRSAPLGVDPSVDLAPGIGQLAGTDEQPGTELRHRGHPKQAEIPHHLLAKDIERPLGPGFADCGDPVQ
jgi:hypothetical protein